MVKYYSTKNYGNDLGLSCCFRQWRSNHSHCSTLHGYSIGVKLIFESDTLDERNWVMDFGGLKNFKKWLEYMFDHTIIVAEDDPHLDKFKELAAIGQLTEKPFTALVDLRIVPAVGCEKFAELAYMKMSELLEESKKTVDNPRYPTNPNVRLKSVEVYEHGANSAIFEG